MSKQVLIRHAAVTVDPHERSDQWALSADGLNAASQLRADPDLAAATRIYSSPEPKALATAHAMAGERLVVALPKLVELDRRSAGWLGSADEYAALVAEILEQPEFSIRGCEPAVAAQARVVAEIDRLARDAGGEAIAVVTHGIVLTLYVSWLRGLPAPDLDLWRRLRFPDVAVVDHVGRIVVREFGKGE
jgi:broad specificity phosphatase PhoE